MGREMDIAIAEKVMGWEPCTGIAIIERETGKLPEEEKALTRWHTRLAWFKDGKRMACDECGTLPQFSESIEAAWAVLTHIIEHWLFSQRAAFFGALRESCRLKDGEYPDGWWMLQVAYEDFPERICAAALLAVQAGRQEG